MMTREALAAMTDDEILAHYRVKWANPYMTLTTAKGLRRGELKYWHDMASARKEA